MGNKRSNLRKISEKPPAYASTILDVWFNDGSLILQAEGRSFRVYGGILAAASSVFRDMISLAEKSPEDDTYGCPVFHVSDSAAELSHFLKALHTVECVYFLIFM